MVYKPQNNMTKHKLQKKNDIGIFKQKNKTRRILHPDESRYFKMVEWETLIF